MVSTVLLISNGAHENQRMRTPTLAQPLLLGASACSFWWTAPILTNLAGVLVMYDIVKSSYCCYVLHATSLQFLGVCFRECWRLQSFSLLCGQRQGNLNDAVSVILVN